MIQTLFSEHFCSQQHFSGKNQKQICGKFSIFELESTNLVCERARFYLISYLMVTFLSYLFTNGVLCLFGVTEGCFVTFSPVGGFLKQYLQNLPKKETDLDLKIAPFTGLDTIPRIIETLEL